MRRKPRWAREYGANVANVRKRPGLPHEPQADVPPSELPTQCTGPVPA
jgi:hypothetical protein